MIRCARTLAVLVLGGCGAPDAAALFADVVPYIEPDGPSADAHLIAVIESAQESLAVALPSGEDAALGDAIVAADARGVAVEVIADADAAESPAVSAIADAEIPLRLADDALTYFDFTSGAPVTWASSAVRMSHAYAIADHDSIATATVAGALGTGPRVVLEARGEDLLDDLLLEHNQVFGGVDATALTSYSEPAKSIVDFRWNYGTAGDTRLEVWLGPQERLVKRVVDAAYGARSDIRILTDDLACEGLITALQAKAADGFSVTVIVGPHFGTSVSAVSRMLEDDAPDVERFQRTGVDLLPTVVLVDYGDTRLGQRATTRAMVITHDLLSASRFYRGVPVPSDQLVDGSLWELTRVGEPSPALTDLESLFADQLALAEPL